MRQLQLTLPGVKIWLDVEQLLPGTDSKDAMVAAVRRACFRFVFLSYQGSTPEECLASFQQQMRTTLAKY